MENEILISGRNLKKYFPVKSPLFGEKKFIKAVDGIDIDIYKGETFGLVGESGCGKSTLGRSLIRMYELTDGKLMYKNSDISKIKGKELKKIQSEMQIIFQDPYSSLNPFWNVNEIVSEPLKEMGADAAQVREKVEYIMNKVGMKTEDLEKYPYEFSGGQRQRIGIARALSVNPSFVMCDEPIAALDVSIQAQVVNMLEELQDEFGLTYIFAAHDLSMVRYISDRIGVMYLGSLVEISESDELYTEPIHPYTKALLSSIPIADPIESRKSRRIHLKGELPDPMSVGKGCRFASRCPYATDICREIMPELKEVKNRHYAACHRIGEF